MAEPKLRIVLEAVDKVSDTLKQVGSSFEQHRKTIGIAMTAVGGSIVAMAGLSVKAALDEQIGINQLAQALKNVGISYDDNKSSIEGLISSMQKMTSYGDGETRPALSTLVALTGDYEMALQALPVVLDTATGLHMDLNSASQLVAKALSGQATMLNRYGFQLEGTATQTEVLTALTEKFGGQAEATADPLKQLNNQFGDLVEMIGTVLLPILKSVIDAIVPVISTLQRWMEEHPGLSKVIIITAVAVGGLMLFLGPLLLILPQLIAAIALFGTVLTVATGPVGIIALAIAGLIAIGILLWKNWDTISAKFAEIWEGIKNTFRAGINFIIEKFNGMIRALNSLSFSVPSWVPVMGGKSFGFNIPEIPTLAQGGIVTRPTLAMIGERGPEAVVPLRKGIAIELHFHAPVYGLTDFRTEVARAVRDAALAGGFKGVAVGGG